MNKVNLFEWGKKKTNFFFLVYLLYEIQYVFFGASQLSKQYDFHKLTFTGSALIMVCLTAIILTNKYTRIEWGIIGVMVVSAVYAYYLGNDNILLMTSLMIAAAKNVDFNVFIKRDFWVRLTLFLMILVLNLVGIISTVTAVRHDSGIRQALGFTQFNTAGALAMSILLEWLFIRFYRLKWFDYLGAIGFTLLIFKFTNSRGAMIASLVMIGIALLYQFKLVEFFDYSILLKIIQSLFLIFTLSSFFVIIIFRSGFSFAIRINQILSDRINILSQYLYGYGLHLIPIKVGTYRQSGVIIMDNAYVMIGVEFGIVILLIFCYLYWRLFNSAIQQRNLALLALGISICMFGLIESTVYLVGVNFTLIALLNTSKYINKNDINVL
jgi:hypothetical protein